MSAADSGKRKLAAILSADVVGYSRLMADDESATVTTLKDYRAVVAAAVAAHGGRVVNAPGDNILAEFVSAVEAVKAACDIQTQIEARNGALAEARRMRFRIGINLGDVIEETDGTIYGDGVNVAARLESLAQPGGICVAAAVFEAVEGKVAVGFEFMGQQQVKNIARPVGAYRVQANRSAKPGRGAVLRPAPRTNRRWIATAAGVIIVLGIAGAWLMRAHWSPLTALIDGTGIANLSPEPTIAVLPFTNLGGNADQEYFADGITADVITSLSRFREMAVIAHSSTQRYKKSERSATEIGGELGARYLLRGEVRRADDRVRINAHLADARSGLDIWSESYDRQLKDIFAIQDDITQQVTWRVVNSLRKSKYDYVQRKSPNSFTAYDLVLRGSALSGDRIAIKDYPAAHRLIDEAISLDPSYARAYTMQAILYFNEVEVGAGDHGSQLKLGEQNVRRALELDPTDSSAHRQMANYYRLTKNAELFKAEVYKALDLNPNDADALAVFGVWFQNMYGMEKLKEGAEMARRAMRLNPFHPGWYRWATLREAVFTQRYADAWTELSKMELDDSYIWRHVFTAYIQSQLGNRELTDAAVKRVLQIKPEYTFKWHMDNVKLHPSYWEEYRRLCRAAGLPLGE